MTSAPFRQLPFDALPEHPRLPHRWLSLEERRVPVWTDAFGDTEASVRIAGQGPPVLLVHGLMTSGYSWRYAWEDLAAHRTVYMPDLVGCGRSSKPDRRYGADAMADWLFALIEALGLVGADAIGNSMGGYLSLRLALRHPGALRRLMVVHAPGVPTPRLWALWLVSRLPGVAPLLAAVVRRDPERWAHTHVHYWDETLKSREEAREYGAPLATREGSLAFVRQLVDVMDAWELRRFAAHLARRRDEGCDFPADVSLVYARRDPMVPPEVGARLEELLPGVALTWLDEASHFAHVDAAARFGALAAAWAGIERAR